jgi:hypothetical protein
MRVLYPFGALTNCLTNHLATYDLEYGTDTLEIYADAIQKETESYLYMMMF